MLYNRKNNEAGNTLVLVLVGAAIIILGVCYFLGITPAEFIAGLA